MGRVIKLECIVCGRKYPYGQGVTLHIAGRDLTFHSKTCTIKFVKLLLEKIPEDKLKPALKETLSEFRKLLEERKKLTQKKL